MRALTVGVVILTAFLQAAPPAAGQAAQEELRLFDTAPAVPFTEGSWTIAVLPDTQSYNDHADHATVLQRMTAWLAQNAAELQLGIVLQVGDIVFQNGTPFAFLSSGDQNSYQQWTNARTAFANLDGVVPYALSPGNHDYGITCAENRKTHYGKFFAPGNNPLVDPAQGGCLVAMGPNAFGEQTLENAAFAFSAPDGRDVLVITLEWGPRQAAVDWAREVASLPEYSGHIKLLVTHAYLNHDNERLDWAAFGDKQNHNPHSYSGTSADTNDGGELWQELVSLCNFDFVFCGHVGGDMVGYLNSSRADGGACHQVLHNAQWLPLGGEGWLRLLEFLPDGRTVRLRTYSPHFDHDGDPDTFPWRREADCEFDMQLTPAP